MVDIILRAKNQLEHQDKTSENKKFNLFLRFGERLPISRLSRNSNNAGFGKISKQIELISINRGVRGNV